MKPIILTTREIRGLLDGTIDTISAEEALEDVVGLT